MGDRSSTHRIRSKITTPTTMVMVMASMVATCQCCHLLRWLRLVRRVRSTIHRMQGSSLKTTETISISQASKVNFLSSSRMRVITCSSRKRVVQIRTMVPSTSQSAPVQTKSPSMSSCAGPPIMATRHPLSCSSKTARQATVRLHALPTTTTPTQDRSPLAKEVLLRSTRDSVSSNSRWELDSVAGRPWLI